MEIFVREHGVHAGPKDDCSGKGLDLAGNLRILNFAPPGLGHLKKKKKGDTAASILHGVKIVQKE
jgi:hypothetical protein